MVEKAIMTKGEEKYLGEKKERKRKKRRGKKDIPSSTLHNPLHLPQRLLRPNAILRQKRPRPDQIYATDQREPTEHAVYVGGDVGPVGAAVRWINVGVWRVHLSGCLSGLCSGGGAGMTGLGWLENMTNNGNLRRGRIVLGYFEE